MMFHPISLCDNHKAVMASRFRIALIIPYEKSGALQSAPLSSISATDPVGQF